MPGQKSHLFSPHSKIIFLAKKNVITMWKERCNNIVLILSQNNLLFLSFALPRQTRSRAMLRPTNPGRKHHLEAF